MAKLVIQTLHELFELDVDDDIEFPDLYAGNWLTFDGKDGTRLSVYSNNVLSVFLTKPSKEPLETQT